MLTNRLESLGVGDRDTDSPSGRRSLLSHSPNQCIFSLNSFLPRPSAMAPFVEMITTTLAALIGIRWIQQRSGDRVSLQLNGSQGPLGLKGSTSSTIRCLVHTRVSVSRWTCTQQQGLPSPTPLCILQSKERRGLALESNIHVCWKPSHRTTLLCLYPVQGPHRHSADGLLLAQLHSPSLSQSTNYILSDTVLSQVTTYSSLPHALGSH